MSEGVSVGDLLGKADFFKEECPVDPKICEVKSEVEGVLGLKCSSRETEIVFDGTVNFTGVPTRDQLTRIAENLRHKNNMNVILDVRVENEHVVIVVSKSLRMIYPNKSLNSMNP